MSQTGSHRDSGDISDNNVSVIDTATNTEIDVDGNPGNGITRIPLMGGENPRGIAVTPDGAFVYVANVIATMSRSSTPPSIAY